jgi:hypothetical protein
MRAMRDIALTAIAIAWIIVLVSPRRHRALARKLAEARRFASRRIVDEEARASSRWEGEGGATLDTNDARGMSPASRVAEAPPR